MKASWPVLEWAKFIIYVSLFRWKAYKSSKIALENRVGVFLWYFFHQFSMNCTLFLFQQLEGKKQHIRPMIIARVQLQHEVRNRLVTACWLSLHTQIRTYVHLKLFTINFIYLTFPNEN